MRYAVLAVAAQDRDVRDGDHRPPCVRFLGPVKKRLDTLERYSGVVAQIVGKLRGTQLYIWRVLKQYGGLPFCILVAMQQITLRACQDDAAELAFEEVFRAPDLC